MRLEFKKQHLGERWGKYQYVPLVRESSKETNPPYAKVKLLHYNEMNDVKTSIYTSTDEGRELIECKNIDEVARAVPFRSTIRFIFKPTVLWKQKGTLKNPMYGLTLKAYKVEVKDPFNPTANYAEDCDFV